DLVTGVQTCALPIYCASKTAAETTAAHYGSCARKLHGCRAGADRPAAHADRGAEFSQPAPLQYRTAAARRHAAQLSCGSAPRQRSEERRVGKEGGRA